MNLGVSNMLPTKRVPQIIEKLPAPLDPGEVLQFDRLASGIYSPYRSNVVERCGNLWQLMPDIGKRNAMPRVLHFPAPKFGGIGIVNAVPTQHLGKCRALSHAQQTDKKIEVRMVTTWVFL